MSKSKRPKQSAARIPTTEKLARALLRANAPDAMIDRARKGIYDDYKSPLATPIIALVSDAREHGLAEIAERAIAGEFEAQKWEGDAWMRSPEGQEIVNKPGSSTPWAASQQRNGNAGCVCHAPSRRCWRTSISI